jgi:hypothetical protein
MPHLWKRCPVCDSEMHPTLLELKHETLSIQLVFNWCKKCHCVTDANVKFNLPTIH